MHPTLCGGQHVCYVCLRLFIHLDGLKMGVFRISSRMKAVLPSTPRFSPLLQNLAQRFQLLQLSNPIWWQRAVGSRFLA